MSIKCDLCGQDEVSEAGCGVLCQACAESIGRLMEIKRWVAALPHDKAVNREQASLLIQFLGESSVTVNAEWRVDGTVRSNAYRTA